MGCLNRWTGIGALGADPELKYGQSGQAMCNLRMACNDTWKDKQGKKQEKTEWVRIVVFGEQGENCSKYLKKGREVCVEGRLQTRMYEKDGQKHYSTEVVADRVVFLGGGSGEKTAPGKQPTLPKAQGRRDEPNDIDVDGFGPLPF